MPSPEPLWHAATRGCDGADCRSPKSCPASTSCHEGNEVDCDRVIDDFVARVNSHPRVPLEPDEVPVALRVACEAHTDKKGYGSTHWKIVAANNVARVEALERRLGQPFPPSFRSLICRYSFPAFECGPMLFFSNTGESLEWELQDRLFADTVMAPQLLAAGYLQIGNPKFYEYDPICIDTKSAGVDGKVVQLFHEAILCDDQLVIRQELAPTFLQLVSTMLVEGAEPGVGADSR